MTNFTEEVTNPSLVSAIREEQNRSIREQRIISEAMKAKFLAPIVVSPSPVTAEESNQAIFKKGTTIAFHTIENTGHQKFFIVFSDWDALRKWRNEENQQTLVISYEDICGMALNEKADSAGFVINPFTDDVIFSKDLILRLKEEQSRRANGGVTECVVQKDTQVFLGQPKVYPKQMVDEISKYLKTRKNVKSAYFFLMMKEGEQSYLIIVDFTGDKKELFGGIAKSVEKHLNGMYLDMSSLDSGFAADSIKNTKPFYKRKSFGLF